MSFAQEKDWPTFEIDPGSPPATLRVRPESKFPTITVLAYHDTELVEETVDNPEDLIERYKDWPVVWIEINGLGDVDFLTRIGKALKLHPLALEDILSPTQRPKVEELGEYEFVLLHAASRKDRVNLEQLGIFFNDCRVVMFQEGPTRYLEPLRNRIRLTKGRIRQAKADYLAYAILDTVVDHYFPVLEVLGDELEDLEDEVMADPAKDIMNRIQQIKRELLTLRRILWPLREVMSWFLSEGSEYVQKDTRPFLRDCYDHVVQAIDLVAAYHEIGAALSDIYLSAVNNRMNEIMKVLTVMATIFIPLTFITGLYGMNFDPSKSPFNMPELEWYFGYPTALTVMALIAGGLLFYFKKRKWL
jgi:magnesium transporter